MGRVHRNRFVSMALSLALLATIPTWSGTKVGEPADAFALQTVDGKTTVKLEEFRGHPALVVFWAVWCPPCRREIPLILDINRKYGPKGLRVVTIALNYRESKKTVVDFKTKHELPYTVLWDEGNKVTTAYGVTGIPTVLLLDAKGVIQFRGHQLTDSFYAKVDALTGAHPKAKPKPKPKKG